MATVSTNSSNVQLGHASNEKNGLMISNYYRSFTYCARANSDSAKQSIANCMIAAYNNRANIKYSQSYRNTDFSKFKQANWNPSKITSLAYTDCSAICAVCCNYAGISVGAFTTNSMYNDIQSTGKFTITSSVSKSGRMVGDILWTPGQHAAVVVSVDGDVDENGVIGTAGAMSSLQVSVDLQDFNSSLDPNNLLGLNDIFDIQTETTSREVERDLIHTVTDDHTHTKSANLLSSPTYVEAPFVIVQIGDYKFGTCSKQQYDSSLKVTFPNFISGMEVTKINGTVNQYKISLVYAIKEGDDPNLVDRILSTVGYGNVKISYGDWCLPTLIYKDEVATITKVTTHVDFSSSKISYQLECTSNAIFLASTAYIFQAGQFKPSDRIKELLQGSYGLQDAFPGMYTQSGKVKALENFIASDDQSVYVPQKNVDVISYINFLTTYMVNVQDNLEEELKTVNYYMTLYDDTYNVSGGPYFKINSTETTIGTKNKTLRTENTYEIDVGYNDSTTSGNNIISFDVVDTNSWALLYKYNDSVQDQSYIYDVDDNGYITSSYVPNAYISTTDYIMSNAQKTWWTQMTQFPLSATVVMKGLVKPVLLMTYLRVNALFYGQRHVTSGLYTITKQVDSVGTSGFRTTLTLMRIAGDDDYIDRTKVTETATRTRFYGKRSADVAADVAKGTSIGAQVSEVVSNVWNKLFSIEVVDDEQDSIVNGAQYVNVGANAQSIWNYLYNIFKNPYAVAGIMGNLQHESGLASNNLQLNGNTALNMTDAEYTKAVDNGSYTKFSSDGYGYGLAQWTYSTRKAALYNLCKQNNKSISDTGTQLQYLISEVKNTGSLYSSLCSSTSVKEATSLFCYDFERPGKPCFETRLTYANSIYNQYAGKN